MHLLVGGERRGGGVSTCADWGARGFLHMLGVPFVKSRVPTFPYLRMRETGEGEGEGEGGWVGGGGGRERESVCVC